MKIFYLSVVALYLFCFAAAAQKKDKKPVKDTAAVKIDGVIEQDIKNGMSDGIPVIALNENDLGDGSTQNISSVLTAGRDPFYTAASFNFSAARFRVRGYDADQFNTFINGVPMENLDNGFTPYGLWGGLNDVMRNKDLSLSLRPNTFAFGDLGTVTNIDARASKQRKQTDLGYAYSNRNYTHRWSFTHSTGISKKGWAFTFSGSRRWADEGYIPGTYYNGWSCFVGIDKRFGQKHLFSLVGFGAPTENGKMGAATAEARDLAGSNYYNPYWGHQIGKKRNANVGRTNQPVLIFTHDFSINNMSSLVSAVAYSFGNRGATGLDWYNAPDPRPDYYRKLPSYYKDDPVQFQLMTNAWKHNENTRQIDWEGLYEANRNNITTFNGTTGKRSIYLLSENVTNSQKLNFNTVYNITVKNVAFTAGASYQFMKNNYFKKILDMLDGDYFVDLNQFAERSYPNNSTVNQNDLNRPNRIIHGGDRYGYDYDININKTSGWVQIVTKYHNIDFFAALELSNTQFWRTGNVKNGLFPNNSYGKSSVYNFNNYSFKGGFTFKIDGRNYFYIHGIITTKAPLYDNVFVSARTRDMVQSDIRSEQLQSVESGYVLNAPKLKIRLSAYYTKFKNQMNVLSYYDDHYQNFVNYALTNISKLHYGMEFGFEAKVLPNVTIDGAAALGRYYYNERQFATTTLDNDATMVSTDSVYAINYRVGGTPQEAYSVGITYRSPQYWFVSLTGNYFDQMWIDFNPIRRTARAVIDVAAGSKERADILAQEQFKASYTLDFFGGYSWKLPRRYNINHKSTFLVFSLGISNLLNNQNIITGGYEQLRFDFATHNVNKFPSKYYYAYSLNYLASITVRF